MSDPKGPKLELPDDLAAEIAGRDTQSNAASAAGDESAAPDSAVDVAADADPDAAEPNADEAGDEAPAERDVATEFAELGSRTHFRVMTWMERRMKWFIAEVFRHHGPGGVLARTWPTGSTVLWVAVLLSLYLLVYFL